MVTDWEWSVQDCVASEWQCQGSQPGQPEPYALNSILPLRWLPRGGRDWPTDFSLETSLWFCCLLPWLRPSDLCWGPLTSGSLPHCHWMTCVKDMSPLIVQSELVSELVSFPQPLENEAKLGVHTCNLSYFGCWGRRITRPAWGTCKTLSQYNI